MSEKRYRVNTKISFQTAKVYKQSTPSKPLCKTHELYVITYFFVPLNKPHPCRNNALNKTYVTT